MNLAKNACVCSLLIMLSGCDFFCHSTARPVFPPKQDYVVLRAPAFGTTVHTVLVKKPAVFRLVLNRDREKVQVPGTDDESWANAVGAEGAGKVFVLVQKISVGKEGAKTTIGFNSVKLVEVQLALRSENLNAYRLRTLASSGETTIGSLKKCSADGRFLQANCMVVKEKSAHSTSYAWLDRVMDTVDGHFLSAAEIAAVPEVAGWRFDPPR